MYTLAPPPGDFKTIKIVHVPFILKISSEGKQQQAKTICYLDEGGKKESITFTFNYRTLPCTITKYKSRVWQL